MLKAKYEPFQWSVWTRFSHVRDFRRHFLSFLSMQEGLSLPGLPPRRLTGNLSHNVIITRMKRLETFFGEALRLASSSEARREIYSFFASLEPFDIMHSKEIEEDTATVKIKQ